MLPNLTEKPENVLIGQAISGDRKDECAELLYKTYLESGYIQPNAAKTRIVDYDYAATFMGCDRPTGKVVITGSIFNDDPGRGLPIDRIFKEETDKLRSDGRRLVEVGALASDKNYRLNDKSLPLWIDMAILRHCIFALKADNMLITTHPRYQHIYEKIWLFEKIGFAESFDYVSGKPAVALNLDLGTIKARLRELYGGMPAENNLYDFVFWGE